MLSIIKIVKQNSLIIEKLMIVQTDTFRGSRPRPFDDISEPAKEEKTAQRPTRLPARKMRGENDVT
jgi:hypothetical protein